MPERVPERASESGHVLMNKINYAKDNPGKGRIEASGKVILTENRIYHLG